MGLLKKRRIDSEKMDKQKKNKGGKKKGSKKRWIVVWFTEKGRNEKERRCL